MKGRLTYSWNISAKILNSHISSLSMGSSQKKRVSPYRLPCFASGTLICLKPGLICNFVQGTRDNSKTTSLSRSSSGHIQIHLKKFKRKMGESRLLPGGPIVAQRDHQQKLSGLIFPSSISQISSYQVY